MPQGSLAHTCASTAPRTRPISSTSASGSTTATYRTSQSMRRTSMKLSRTAIQHPNEAPYRRGMTTSTTSTTSLSPATEELRSGLKTQLGTVLDSLDAGAAALVAISPQTPDNSLTLAEQAELAFPVLSDVGNAVARSYGLVYALGAGDRELHSGVGIDLAAFNGEDSWELPAPAVFVVDADGTIRYASVAGDYRWRVGPDEVLAALRA